MRRGDYCDVPLTDCPGVLGNVTAAPGECHRNCFSQGCTCTVDADCPGGRCALSAGAAHCTQVGAGCLEPLRCSPGCVQENLVEACPVCICSTCPPPDGG